jgi:hypothetical protein
MAQMTPQVSKLLEQALSLSVEEQEALADSLISSLGEKVDDGVRAAWDDEIKKRITDAGFGQGKNRSLVQSSQSQFSEAGCPILTSCSPTLGWDSTAPFQPCGPEPNVKRALGCARSSILHVSPAADQLRRIALELHSSK